MTFEGRTVRVTFDAAASGLDQATFEGVRCALRFPGIRVHPVAFNDALGNRLRPAIGAIETVRADGTSLGTIDAAEILALNGLSK